MEINSGARRRKRELKEVEGKALEEREKEWKS